MTLDSRSRWLALLIVCLGDLMIVLDVTIVGVALPSIREDLGFSETSLAWVVNAYLLTFGGFLLLGGRAGDLFGRRRVFVFGLALFTFASLLCGLAGSQGLLVAARALQGVGGAIIAPAALCSRASVGMGRPQACRMRSSARDIPVPKRSVRLHKPPIARAATSRIHGPS